MEIVELVLAGAFIGLMLGVLGAGGAIFTAPLLMFGFDVPPREATTVSLVVVLLAAAQRSGRSPWHAHGPVARGCRSSGRRHRRPRLPARGSRRCFPTASSPAGFAAPAARRRRGDGASAARRSEGEDRAVTAGRGLPRRSGSVWSPGFFGVGGGFVIVPALVLVLGFGIREATATGLLVIAINAVGRACRFAARSTSTGPSPCRWRLGAVAGSFAGATLAPRHASRAAAPGIRRAHGRRRRAARPADRAGLDPWPRPLT